MLGAVKLAAITTRVAKAKADADIRPVYDQEGNLVGVCPADEIQPVTAGRRCQGGSAADAVAVLKSRFRNGATPAEQTAAFNELNAAAVATLAAIHARGPGPRARPAGR